ncbi:hypothetical protein DEDE109153_18075 [Deinococcus deserti]|uniref:Uncharacterized protein n=1 Tax=Deinococcus deserti (strain DSM 17065 / CIP 109153 / LMG 22923 / VCD115) TaxID=546414 RepID=C1CYD0_DEIDV|nr:hypothetical protein [Deinococcus deserti]ACO44951.1 hypothetical protein Deide_01434 [Deinococcus deserti VCD115]
MKTIQDTIGDMKHKVQHAEARTELKTAAQLQKEFAKQQASMVAVLGRQQKELQQVQQELEEMRRKHSSEGGFPWGMLLIAGGAYALYRTNPSVRQTVQDLLKRVNPGIEGNLTRAGDAVAGMAQGDKPGTALRAAGGELKRAGEKAVDSAEDKLK